MLHELKETMDKELKEIRKTMYERNCNINSPSKKSKMIKGNKIEILGAKKYN